ncbi:ABC transporter ATP-binding protein [Methylobacterium frigidaeris]|uniref:Osmoprotectant import ATP-binding protein OsmV n=3 Tax=Methylobacterium frigidaeris TaxID=2038277 RepID=A0AA37M521_9HYPH|nr:ABC transporter ATP-binding protein [Methylobacterium frigidaeris]GJD62755.1 Osmoprotectant import ATP-binding protein OsmV [Methylobacterium frigidaeris]
MIRFEGAAKTYPGQTEPALDAFDLAVEAGTTCVLIGPSGCGKSTALQLVNRLVVPSAGRVLVEGRDVAGLDPIGLRRRIGYVLQGVGLFPHRTVAQNVATVPGLLGWTRARITERVDAMLDLVGLEPGQYRDRRPDALSGGQRQRVGVARALAADPPVLLMDEPFGAVDPVARTRLQDEVRGILGRLQKTVLMVTHDIDEAVRMGDTVALMRDGRLVQVAPPAALLAAPADAFAAEFVGGDRLLRRLSLLPARDHAEPGPAGDAPRLSPDASLKDALALMLASGRERVGLAGGSVTLAALRAAAEGGPSA